MRICVAGACGRMGRRVLEAAAQAEDVQIGGAFDLPEQAGSEVIAGSESGVPVSVKLSSTAEEALNESDVLIDFTHADHCLDHIGAAVRLDKACVVATTGLNSQQESELAQLARQTAVVYASNMSLGVNLLFKLTRDAAKALGPEYNIEIVEMHHNQKVDSPSGTAVTLGKRAAEARNLDYGKAAVHGREGHVGKRPVEEIGMHAVRGGNVPGEHTVYFIGNGERIELTHRALTRDIFAQGALTAARYAVAARRGLYSMQDVLGMG